MSSNKEPWTESAACRSVGGDLWYPDIGSPTFQQARMICQGCPVMWQCLDWVMRSELGVNGRYRYGMTGGMTPSQRVAYEPQWLAEQAGAA